MTCSRIRRNASSTTASDTRRISNGRASNPSGGTSHRIGARLDHGGPNRPTVPPQLEHLGTPGRTRVPAVGRGAMAVVKEIDNAIPGRIGIGEGGRPTGGTDGVAESIPARRTPSNGRETLGKRRIGRGRKITGTQARAEVGRANTDRRIHGKDETSDRPGTKGVRTMGGGARERGARERGAREGELPGTEETPRARVIRGVPGTLVGETTHGAHTTQGAQTTHVALTTHGARPPGRAGKRPGLEDGETPGRRLVPVPRDDAVTRTTGACSRCRRD